jgi:hypothetical protein
MAHEDALATLRRFARGPVLTKADAELYDAARECFNRGLDERPEIIVQCQGAADVKRALAYCRATSTSFTVAAGNLRGHQLELLLRCIQLQHHATATCIRSRVRSAMQAESSSTCLFALAATLQAGTLSTVQP